MYVVVEVLTGPNAGGCFRIPEGGAASFGRSQAAQFVIADNFMSSVHFSLQYIGLRCTVRDAGSSNGTYVNGVRINECDVRPGDSIQAGQTRFRIRLESAPVASPAIAVVTEVPAGPSTAPMAITLEWDGFSPAQAAFLHLLYDTGEPVFAVLDSAREDRMPAFLHACQTEHVSLFEGREAEALQSVAPYLALLPKTSLILEPLIKEGFGKSWGIYMNSRSSLVKLRHHLRRFLRVRGEHGETSYFRFYDPRVIRELLPQSTPEGLIAFFGPISRFIMEAGEPETAVEFRKGKEGLEKRDIPLK